MAVAITLPRQQNQQTALMQLNAAPPSTMQAPAPSGAGGFTAETAGSLVDQISRFLGESDKTVVALSKDSRFTRQELEVKNQERVKAFDAGPVFPTGHSSGGGANTLQPFVNANFNRERLNAGEPVKPALGAARVRGIGNAFSTGPTNAGTWAAMAQIQTGMANTDSSGLAQIDNTGTMIAAEPTTQHLERGRRPGGPLYGQNMGGPNSGAAFDQQDGAAGGDVAKTALQHAQARGPEFAYAPPTGAGTLSVPRAYGIAALLGQ